MLFVCFVSFLVISYVSCEIALEEPTTEDNVYVLNNNNFENFVGSHKVVLVEFYAPWCGHCKSFAPTYSDIAAKLKTNHPPIPVAKVDATTETNLATRYEVDGYPTLKFFRDSKVYNYEGPRNAESIIDFMKSVQSPNWKEPDNYVLTLTHENFTETIQSNDYMLVEFYAPWCGHCKKLAPEYSKASRYLYTNNYSIRLAVVDAIAEKELAENYKVTSYPTLKLFRNGRATNYNGPRYSDGIVEWLIKQKENAAKLVETNAQLKNLRHPEKTLLLGLFESKDVVLFKTFMDAANAIRDDFISAYSFSDELKKQYQFNKYEKPAVIFILKPEYFHNKFEPDFVVFKEDEISNITIESLITFFETSMFPLVGDYTIQTKKFYDKQPKEYLCFFFFTVDWTIHHRSATKFWLNKIVDIAVHYANKIQFVVADDESVSYRLKEFRLNLFGEDMNVGCLKGSNTKFRMDPMDEFDSAHIRKFLDNLLAGSIFPLLKSSPASNGSSTTFPKVVVGDTYKQLVNDDKTISLILLYRSPCGECDNVRKVLSGVSSKLSFKPFNFFAMDLNANDLPPIDGLENVDTRPSLYLITELNELHMSSLLRKKLTKFTGNVNDEHEILGFIQNTVHLVKSEL